MLRAPRALRPPRSATVWALLVVAAVAIFQSSVILSLLRAQHDAAHVIDIGGAQRMRSQRLAFLAVSLHDPLTATGTRAEIDKTIDELLEARREIALNRAFDIEPRDASGRTATMRLADAYLAAIRALERNPRDERAYAEVMRLRLPMLDAFDRTVKARVRIVNAHDDELLAALLLGLLFQLVGIACVWLAIVAPAQRRSDRLLRDLSLVREQIESSFAHNPDAIAVFDSELRIERANDSHAILLGYPIEELSGRRFGEFFAADRLEDARPMIERAKRGETVTFETQMLARDGSPVDVALGIFARIVDGRATGYNVVARDLRKLRAAEAQNVEQGRRLADLYEIASSHGRTGEQQLESALGLVGTRLGYDYGVLSETAGDAVNVVATWGTPQGLAVVDRRSLVDSLARLSIVADVFQARDFRSTTDATAQIAAAYDWRAVAGMKIVVGGTLYGTVGFASRRVRDADLGEPDIAFMRLACALLGTILERGRQLRRLGALAFTDSLTALPNRMHFTKRIAELVALGEPFGLHYVDLDRFKKVNDRCGHAVGDRVLTLTAEFLLACAGPDDFVARLGGDEFAILQRPAFAADGADLASRIVRAFRKPIDIGGIRHDVGASVGLALFPEHGPTVEALVNNADNALYRAKRGGRGRYALPDGEPQG